MREHTKVEGQIAMCPSVGALRLPSLTFELGYVTFLNFYLFV